MTATISCASAVSDTPRSTSASSYPASSASTSSRLIPAPAPAKPVPPLLVSLFRAYGSCDLVLRTEIRIDHALVSPHFVRGALRYYLAIVHHDHSVACPHHEVEVVLDDQQRDSVALAQCQDVLEQIDAQRGADPGHG